MGFSPAALTFLRGLKRTNTKPWFEAHRAEYDDHVRDPMRALIDEMDVRFGTFAPEFTGDPKRSMFRIHRDIRFAKDKSPYKTHAACWFAHRDGDGKVGQGAEGGGAGFYFHLEPGASFAGGGIWMPPSSALNRIRDALADDHGPLEQIVREKTFVRRFGALDDSAMLKRMPRGFTDDHPGAEWLRFKSFTVGRPLTDKQVTGSGLAKRLEADYAVMLPLVRWLNAALGLRPATRR
jgi:uncharacterized protein (TIGR02453 family)